MKKPLESSYCMVDGVIYADFGGELNNDDVSMLGKYGLMRLSYLKEHKPELYAGLLVKGKLICHCREINDRAYEMLETIEKQILQETGQQSSDSFWENYQQRQQAHDVAEESALHDLVYN